MDRLFERVCWIAAYCASLAGQRASEGVFLGVGCFRIISDNDAQSLAMEDARMAVEVMKSIL